MSSSQLDQLDRWRRRRFVAMATTSATIAATSLWAVLPILRQGPQSTSATRQSAAIQEAVATVSRVRGEHEPENQTQSPKDTRRPRRVAWSAFEISLWIRPAAPTKADPPPPTPPKPPRVRAPSLELIAILLEDGTATRAAVREATRPSVRLVAVGNQIENWVVTSIDAHGVTVRVEETAFRFDLPRPERTITPELDRILSR